MAYSPSPSTAPQSPHLSGLRSATSVIVEQEKYLSELLGERQKLSPFVPVLPHLYRLLNHDVRFNTALLNTKLAKFARWHYSKEDHEGGYSYREVS